MIEIGRRGFLAGTGALLAAPAIVRVASLMPVQVVRSGHGYEVALWESWVALKGQLGAEIFHVPDYLVSEMGGPARLDAMVRKLGAC